MIIIEVIKGLHKIPGVQKTDELHNKWTGFEEFT